MMLNDGGKIAAWRTAGLFVFAEFCGGGGVSHETEPTQRNIRAESNQEEKHNSGRGPAAKLEVAFITVNIRLLDTNTGG